MHALMASGLFLVRKICARQCAASAGMHIAFGYRKAANGAPGPAKRGPKAGRESQAQPMDLRGPASFDYAVLRAATRQRQRTAGRRARVDLRVARVLMRLPSIWPGRAFPVLGLRRNGQRNDGDATHAMAWLAFWLLCWFACWLILWLLYR